MHVYNSEISHLKLFSVTMFFHLNYIQRIQRNVFSQMVMPVSRINLSCDQSEWLDAYLNKLINK